MRKIYNLLILLVILSVYSGFVFSSKTVESIKSENKPVKKQNSGPVYPPTKPRPFAKRPLLA